MSGVQVDGLEGRFGEDEVEERGVVCLHDEEEDFLEGNLKQLRPNNDVARIAPNAVADEVGIPRNGGGNGDLVVVSAQSPIKHISSRTATRKAIL